jgi:hypothetical protein
MNRGIETRLQKLEARSDPAEIYIVGFDFTECRLRADAMEAAGELAGRVPCCIITGVPRSEGYGNEPQQ